MTGSASRKPRPVGGDEGRIDKRTLPYREAPPCGRGASISLEEAAIREIL